MMTDRRSLLALGAALPLLAAAAAPDPAITGAPLADAWRRLFAGRDGAVFAWWLQGTLFAHVDGLREFPVLGSHAVMICRTNAGKDGTALDFRTIGFFSDLETGRPAAAWDNVFTGRREPIPPHWREGPGRYAMAPRGADVAVTLAADATRTNRLVVTAARQEGRTILTQIEGTLQGFPRRDGTLPPQGDPAITERQTRIQLIEPTGNAPVRGYVTQVYDALPPWLGFGERLGSGLVKGMMRKARADEIVDAASWAYLRTQVPDAFAGGRLVLA